MLPSRKGILLVLLAIVLVISVIISDKMQAWCLAYFGEGYQKYLLGFFVLGSVGVLFLTTDIGKHLRPGAESKSGNFPPGTPDPELVAKVRKYLATRYEHRLGQKLAGRQPVNLRILPSSTGTSKEGVENYITLQEEEVRAAIGDIFTRANGRLLLVGLPGAGKTTLVLQLALYLLERPGGSMPVVLNLATWRAEFKTFEEWLKKILPAELGASTGLADQIRKHIPLILLLDGLDEVPEADRDSLITGIGEYGADARRQFLISSRIAEYAATKDAPVNAQVEVAPLTVEQVEMGLAATAGIQPESKRLLNALKTDPLLRSAVENPFYLNTAQLLFSTGKNWSELGFVAQDVSGRQRELVDRFVEGAMGRGNMVEYPGDKARHWLSFLAARIVDRNMAVFELRDLQYDWWQHWSRWHLAQAGLVNALVIWLGGMLLFGLVTWLPFELSVGLGGGLVVGLVVVLVVGLVVGLNKHLPPIETKDNINWSWKNLRHRLFNKENLVVGLVVGLIVGLIVGPFVGLVNVLFAVLAGGLFTVSNSPTDILQITSPYHRFNASKKALHFSILQHKLLCYQLLKQGLLPPDLVKFLNEMSLRHILEFDGDPATGKGGGSWRFRHRILQDYFTAKYFADNAYKGTLKELVDAHLYDNTWKEIFLLVARKELIANELLLLMLKKNREMLQEPVGNVQKSVSNLRSGLKDKIE